MICIVSDWPLDGDTYAGRSLVRGRRVTAGGNKRAWRSIKDITLQRHNPIDHIMINEEHFYG